MRYIWVVCGAMIRYETLREQVSEYIRQRKLDVAKNMLRFSDMDLVEIANTLSYSSQSHFIQHFRQQTGMTPKAYRNANYMNNWNVNRDEDINPMEE